MKKITLLMKPPGNNMGVDTSFWDSLRGRILTKRGGWIIGEAVYNCGYSMLDDLVGSTTFFQVLILNVTGRLPERRIADWFEALFICLSWPDARVWCNQIGSLAGTLRCSPVAAVCSGTLASDSNMYGPGTLLAATNFISEALEMHKNGLSAEEIISKHQRRPTSPPNIVGYGRPVAKGDERVAAMLRTAKQLDFGKGDHLKLALELEAVIGEKFNESMNLAGYLTAFLCDLGFNATEIYRISSMMVNSGVHACYAEAADNPPEAFFPLQCNDIDYQGIAPRPLPARE
nr:hypothetical protein [Desulfobulbaceae bacterium]